MRNLAMQTEKFEFAEKCREGRKHLIERSFLPLGSNK